MSTTQYAAKISSQGQITLPRAMRDQLAVVPGNFVTIRLVGRRELEVSDELPISQAFGSLGGSQGNSITGGQDAVAYTRQLRRGMERKRFEHAN
jgi:bifunctional DNA-binding transcriptional regulator/antitoxin component of YhaV-PrlF toxin-antitoxin module